MVAFIAILTGGRAKRDHGWKMLVVLLGINGIYSAPSCRLVTLGSLLRLFSLSSETAVVQCTAASLINYLYDYDDRFFAGWKLDLSWILATVSWSIMALLAVSVAMAGWLLPLQGGYVLLK